MSTKPHCIGFIMDGNRRWAKTAGLPTLEGHRRGHEVFVECVRFLRDEQIEHGVFYAFSTENWQRTKDEVAYLMNLFAEVLGELQSGVEEERVRVRIIGNRSDFSTELQQQMTELETKSAQYEGTTIWIALSYGGRREIVEGVNQAIALGQNVTEESFKNLLWSADLPDPDIIVRTSGEQRLSNFLTWGSVYSELLFLDKHWPALTNDDFKEILQVYESRERRRGK
jgi:undecaprenyl diphosphate synthase